MENPKISGIGGIFGLIADGTEVKNIGKFIEIVSTDGSILLTADTINKRVDVKVASTSPEFECDSAVSEGDLVYSDTGGILKKAKADSPLTMPAIGYVAEKIDVTHCKIESVFIEEGLSGIGNNQPYFVSDSTAGEFTAIPPTGVGKILQNVGRGVGSDKRFVNIDPSNKIIRK